jgi:uncharacterized membrane protein YfcA
MMHVRLGDRAAPTPRLEFSPRVALAGLAVGVLTGFFGVGGFLIVPTLVLGLPMREAVGTSLVVIAINAAVALVGHLRFGEIDLTVTQPFILEARRRYSWPRARCSARNAAAWARRSIPSLERIVLT